MNEGTAIVLLILGPLALGLLGRFLRNHQRLRLHEMAHQERILALEKGLPVPDVPAGGELDPWSDRTSTERLLESGWDRRVTLAIGLIMFFGSIGALLFAWLLPSTTRDAADLKLGAALAVIPFMASVGMLLYYRLTAPGRT